MATAQQNDAIGLRNGKRVWIGIAVGVFAAAGAGAMYAEKAPATKLASQRLAMPEKTSLMSVHNVAPVEGALASSVGAPVTAESSQDATTTHLLPKLFYGASTKALTVDDTAVIALLANQDDSICMTPECGRADVDQLEQDAANGTMVEREKEAVENNVAAGIVLALMRSQIVRVSNGRPAPDNQIREDLATQPPVESIMILARQKARQLIAAYAPDARAADGEPALHTGTTTSAGSNSPTAAVGLDTGASDDSELARIFTQLHPQPYAGMSGAVLADVIEYCRRNGGMLPEADRQWATQTIATDALVMQSQFRLAKQGSPMTYENTIQYLTVHGVDESTRLRYYHTAETWFNNNVDSVRFCHVH
jgi:hypothetical protein